MLKRKNVANDEGRNGPIEMRHNLLLPSSVFVLPGKNKNKHLHNFLKDTKDGHSSDVAYFYGCISQN